MQTTAQAVGNGRARQLAPKGRKSKSRAVSHPLKDLECRVSKRAHLNLYPAPKNTVIFKINPAIMPSVPSSALYSRCFRYKSKENPPDSLLASLVKNRGNIRGT